MRVNNETNSPIESLTQRNKTQSNNEALTGSYLDEFLAKAGRRRNRFSWGIPHPVTIIRPESIQSQNHQINFAIPQLAVSGSRSLPIDLEQLPEQSKRQRIQGEFNQGSISNPVLNPPLTRDTRYDFLTVCESKQLTKSKMLEIPKKALDALIKAGTLSDAEMTYFIPENIQVQFLNKNEVNWLCKDFGCFSNDYKPLKGNGIHVDRPFYTVKKILERIKNAADIQDSDLDTLIKNMLRGSRRDALLSLYSIQVKFKNREEEEANSGTGTEKQPIDLESFSGGLMTELHSIQDPVPIEDLGGSSDPFQAEDLPSDFISFLEDPLSGQPATGFMGKLQPDVRKLVEEALKAPVENEQEVLKEFLSVFGDSEYR
ncbi:MAG TPA: hypothetical protein VLG49_05435 [Rhabdochlamydiaceae bacterium]|nr:hypothetical protein [Rhabdochlamydiaceae bacterium]